MKGVYIFLADGFEDIEALGTLDVLRRGGVEASLVSVSDEPFVVSSHRVAVGVDYTFEELVDSADLDSASEEDVMIFPGGMPGSKTLASHKELIKLMKKHYAAGGTVAAICAAPGLVLSQLGGLDEHIMTCFDGFESGLIDAGAAFVPKQAFTSERIITGRSAGYGIPFGLEILKKIKGEDAAEKVRAAMLLPVCE